MAVASHIESLESRRLLSISLAHHVVNVQGAIHAPNTISVGLTPGGASVFATVSYPTRKGIFSQTKTFPLSKRILLINIGGGNMSDLITVDQTNGSFPIATHIVTRAGNDTVMGGDEPDRIICGNGIDQVNSGNGNDALYAGRGPDTLVGGDGNDHLQSGPGHDVLVAGNGNSTFVDPFGNVTLQGGSGHDTYILKGLKFDPDNNYNPAKDTYEHYIPPSNKDNLLNDILNGLIDYGSYL